MFAPVVVCRSRKAPSSTSDPAFRHADIDTGDGNGIVECLSEIDFDALPAPEVGVPDLSASEAWRRDRRSANGARMQRLFCGSP